MTPTFALLDFGAPELLLILAILLLLFGGKKLPELSRSLGQSFREIKKGAADATELRKDVRHHVDETRRSLTGMGQSTERREQNQDSDQSA